MNQQKKLRFEKIINQLLDKKTTLKKCQEILDNTNEDISHILDEIKNRVDINKKWIQKRLELIKNSIITYDEEEKESLKNAHEMFLDAFKDKKSKDWKILLEDFLNEFGYERFITNELLEKIKDKKRFMNQIQHISLK